MANYWICNGKLTALDSMHLTLLKAPHKSGLKSQYNTSLQAFNG